MPRKPPKQRRHASGHNLRVLSDKLYRVLHGELSPGDPLASFLDECEYTVDELRDAWSIHGDTLTAEHRKAYPGSRPWAWWLFSAPEPRRQWFEDGYIGVSETDRAYLERVGLLCRAERRALAAGNYKARPTGAAWISAPVPGVFHAASGQHAYPEANGAIDGEPLAQAQRPDWIRCYDTD